MTKILLVEDDKSLREIYGVRLLAEGYDIVSAGDGEEALAMAIKERPNLIVSDVMMPKISGFDMLDILRSTTETRDIKVIMMTALSSEDQRQRGEALGADRYLVKSQVGIEDVVRTVHDVLNDGHLTVEQRTAAKQVNTPQTASIPAPQQIQTTQQQQAPQQVPSPIRAEAPNLAQPERERVTQPFGAQPTSPILSQPKAMDMVAAQPQQPVQTQQQIQQPAQPISDFVNIPTRTNQNESTLPQPIAPFSTDRPSGLGERIIQPINDPAIKNNQDMISFQMNDILNGGTGENPLNQSQNQNPQNPLGA